MKTNFISWKPLVVLFIFVVLTSANADTAFTDTGGRTGKGTSTIGETGGRNGNGVIGDCCITPQSFRP